MKSLLIDSDVIIDYTRGLEESKEFFRTAKHSFILHISVVGLVEVYSGRETKNLAKQKEIEEFFSNFEIALITPAIAKAAGILRRDYARPFADTLIAATAIEYGFVLATRNIKHFKGLPGLKLIKPY